MIVKNIPFGLPQVICTVVNNLENVKYDFIWLISQKEFLIVRFLKSVRHSRKSVNPD
jgi:hypothetical protein